MAKNRHLGLVGFVLKPMIVTGKQFITSLIRPITTMYPYESAEEREYYRRGNVRGQHQIDWQKCIGCGLCSRVCPNECITLERIEVGPENPFKSSRSKMDEMKKIVKRPGVDLGHCLYCGLCAEFCPSDAWGFVSKIELADFSRENLYFSAEELRSKKEEYTGRLVNKIQENPVLDVNRCIGCMRCQRECPTGCIEMIPGPNIRKDKPIMVPQFNYELCVGCESCASVCPAKCLIMEEF